MGSLELYPTEEQEVEFRNSMTQKAARRFQASKAAGNLHEIELNKSKLLVIAYLFSPYNELGKRDSNGWRSYTIEQYLIATGEEIEFAEQPLSWWDAELYKLGSSLNPPEVDGPEDEDLAAALLGQAS